MRIMIAASALLLGACSASAPHNNMQANGNLSATMPPVSTNTAASATGAVQAYAGTFATRWPTGVAATPAEVRAMVTGRGARATVQALAEPADGPNRWTSVIRGIALGEQVWLDLVPQIRGGTDAGTTDDLVIALSDAVVSNPAAALRLFASPNDAGNFCRENGFETPTEQSRAFYAAATAAVEGVTAPDLQEVKAVCLDSLRRHAV